MTEERTLGEQLGNNSQAQLVSFVERIERLLEEAAGLREDTKEVFAEAKGAGFDPKIMRMAIRIRAMDQAKRQEQDALVALYLDALGDA